MKINGKIYYTIVILLAISLFAVNASAQTNLPPVKMGECVNLPQTCATCTYNNLSIVLYPNKTAILLGEYAMTKNGISYNYTFCNTTAYGTYFVDGHGNPAGIDTDWGGYTFIVNGSGQDVTSQQVTMIIIGMAVLLIVTIFFYVLSLTFKHPGTKIFLMAMSGLTLIVLIGLTASQFAVYLAEFLGLASFYDKFYLLTMIVSGALMIGLIMWLIYYAFTTFSKVRVGDLKDD